MAAAGPSGPEAFVEHFNAVGQAENAGVDISLREAMVRVVQDEATVAIAFAGGHPRALLKPLRWRMARGGKGRRRAKALKVDAAAANSASTSATLPCPAGRSRDTSRPRAAVDTTPRTRASASAVAADRWRARAAPG